MDTVQKKNLKSRIDSLTKEKEILKKKLNAVKNNKQSIEKELRNVRKILMDVPCPVLFVQGRKIILANDMACELFGYTKAELEELDLLNLVHPRSDGISKKSMKSLISGKSVPPRTEIRLQKNNGTSLTCEIRWKKTRFYGRAAFLVNILDLEEPKEKERQARESEKSKIAVGMATGLHGDLKKIFNNIDKQLAILKETDTQKDNDLHHLIKNINFEMDHGKRLVYQLKSLANKEKALPNARLFDLNKVVQDAVSAVNAGYHEILKDRIQIKTYLRNISVVKGRSETIQEACVRLIRNAVDAMQDGGDIYLTTEENAGYAWIYIQDSGTGVSDDIRDRIFDPFFTTKKPPHAGLGLSFAEGIVKRHGGALEMLHQEGSGTTFIIKLPLSGDADKDHFSTRRSKNRIRGSQILVISMGNVMTDLLTQDFVIKGGKVLEVHGCRHGESLLKRKSFDLVVTDIHTPDFRAAETISRIKGSQQNLPLVLVDSDSNKRLSMPLNALGADLIIEKPLEIDKISHHISEIIERHATSK